MTVRKPIVRRPLIDASYFAKSAVATAVALVSFCASAQTLNAFNVAQASAQNTQLRLDFSETPKLPQAYHLDNPPRLVLDFNDVENGLPTRSSEVKQGLIDDVTAINNEVTTRLIIGLNDTVDGADAQFTTLVDGNTLIVNLADTSPNAATVPVATPPVATIQAGNSVNQQPTNDKNQNPPTANLATNTDPVTNNTAGEDKNTTTSETTAKSPMVVRINPLLDPALAANNSGQGNRYNGVNGVTYNSNNVSGGGDINIGLVDASIPVDIQRQGNRIVVRTAGASIPADLVRQHNINGGLVNSINARNKGDNGVITIAMTDDFEYKAYQSGSQVVISVEPPEVLREPTIEEKVYTGEPISVDFQNVELRSVLHLLSQFTDMNIVASDNVGGTITVNLINVPWDQALDIILKSKNLDTRANGNVILVAPAAELAEQEARELAAQQKVQEFLPLRTEYIRLSYAKADDILRLISQGRHSGAGLVNRNEDMGTLLSDRGTVTVDARTNTLIVKDTAGSIENIRALIDKIDIPVRQVMIEVRIVSANESFSKEMGVRWGILSEGAATNNSLLVGGSQQTLADLRDFTVESTTVNGQTITYPSYNITRPDNLNVDLGVANPAGSIAFGLLEMSDLMIDLELSAMQADGRGEIISTPKVLTTDKQTAKVASGTQIPYQEATASGATSTSFVEAALSLEATPNITPDGKIGLELLIENGRPRLIGNTVAIEEDSLTTNVIVEDGQTVVLGGIFRNQTSNGADKVPFLGDLPMVGRLFKNDRQLNDKQELLIFVTPKLINDGVSQIH